MKIKAMAWLWVVAGALAPQVASGRTVTDLEFWTGPQAYLGQQPPSETPQVFAPGRLAESGSFVMGRVAFSQDGKEFYYTQGDSWNSLDNAKIRQFRFADGRWHGPTTVNETFVSPTLSLDQQTLYFRKGNMNNVWASERAEVVWGPPAPLIEHSAGVYDFMPTLGGRYYVGSDPGPDDVAHGSTYVFSTLRFDGEKVEITSLGRPLNGPGFNGDFYVAPDESYMIVSANVTKDFESELHISFRKPDSSWTVPVSLGPEINDGLAHRWGQYVSPDGKYLFYSHGTSEEDCAVYWVRFDGLLERMRARALP